MIEYIKCTSCNTDMLKTKSSICFDCFSTNYESVKKDEESSIKGVDSKIRKRDFKNYSKDYSK